MRSYISESKDGSKRVRLVYLGVGGGNNFGPTLGEICTGSTFGNCSLDIRTFDGGDTVRDPVEFSALKDAITDCDLFLFYLHGDPSNFKRYDKLKEHIGKHGVNTFLLCMMPESMREAASMFRGEASEYMGINRYLSLGGRENAEGFLRYICSLYGDGDIEVPEPVVQRMQGVYHPGMDRDITREAYLETLDPSKPTVGVILGQGSWLNGDTEPQDLLIRCIEDHGANTLPIFTSTQPSEVSGSLGVGGSIDAFFKEGERRLVDCVVMCGFGFSSLAVSCDGGERRNYFQELGVPVLAGLGLFRPQSVWREDGIGMDGGELAVTVAMPELDGQLTTIPYTFTETDEEGRQYRSFIPERIDHIAKMAVRWAKVGRKPVSERRVSILFNGGALSNASIGSAGGLDSLESVARILSRLKDEGYSIDHVPQNGRELIDEMLESVTNNLEWATDSLIEDKAVDFTSVPRYREWTDREPPSYMEWVCRNWGEPAGEIMTHRGRFIVPGVRNGNIYLGYEPERGKHAQAESLIHDPDLSTPHSYLAYYRWISEIFDTDVHIHVGTHGSVEWLPGKGNGLSEECFPDIMMDDIPQLYIYVIDDPSEGIVAKRRKKSVLVDHMMPSLTRADTYEELADLEGHIQGYLFSKQTMQKAKMDSEGETIYELIGKMSLWQEIGMEEGTPIEEVLEKCEVIFDYIEGLKDGLITDGLHIAGKVPEGRRMEEMVYCLTRLKNGRTPSLRQAIAKSMGYDLDTLLDCPSAIDPASGELHGQITDRIDSRMQEYIHSMHEIGFDLEESQTIGREMFGDYPDIRTVTEYICSDVHPRICRITEEVDNLVVGMNGGYVPPGPSGAPTRGNAHLLPTGKNFYSLDPETVPSEESWKLGRKMADDMLAQYIEREGKYPESVGIVVWSIDTMKTGGDDVAYILWLLGIRPIWGSVGGKITGLEVIDRETLGRPRIDVTVRISSLFRDTFPNLFQLIDEAVEMAAGIEESEEDNYLRKHLREDIAEMIKDGLSKEEAESRALIRVFGEPPGTYGAGVNILVESSKWDSVDDLAQIYITCGCSAYGRKWRGEKMPELFRHRLVGLDVAVKNQVDREIDLIDVDDGYAYLGGINAVIRAAGKERPVNYLCDTSDPDRIKTRDLEHEMAYILRTRVLNPKWVDGLKEHGFVGANLVHDNVNHVFGWDATSDVIEPWMYEAITDKFILNDDNREWIRSENPWSLRDMIEDLLEAVDRGMWDADQEYIDRLKEIYLETVGDLEEIALDRDERRTGQ